MLVEPLLWHTVRRLFDLDAATAHAWWDALTVTTRPQAVSWRQRILFYDTRPSWNREPEAVQRYLLRSMLPKEMVDVVEALVEEGQLPRRTGTLIQELIMARMTAAGGWHDNVREP